MTTQEYDKIIGSIREKRMESGMYQYTLAEKIGMDQSSLAKIELGKQKPRIPTLNRILVALNMNPVDENETIENNAPGMRKKYKTKEEINLSGIELGKRRKALDINLSVMSLMLKTDCRLITRLEHGKNIRNCQEITKRYMECLDTYEKDGGFDPKAIYDVKNIVEHNIPEFKEVLHTVLGSSVVSARQLAKNINVTQMDMAAFLAVLQFNGVIGARNGSHGNMVLIHSEDQLSDRLKKFLIGKPATADSSVEETYIVEVKDEPKLARNDKIHTDPVADVSSFINTSIEKMVSIHKSFDTIITQIKDNTDIAQSIKDGKCEFDPIHLTYESSVKNGLSTASVSDLDMGPIADAISKQATANIKDLLGKIESIYEDVELLNVVVSDILDKLTK